MTEHYAIAISERALAMGKQSRSPDASAIIFGSMLVFTALLYAGVAGALRNSAGSQKLSV